MLYLLFTRQLKPGKKRLSLLKRSLLCCHGYDELFLNSFFPFTTYNLYYDFYILFYFKYNFSNKLPFCLSLVTTKLPCDTVTPQSPSTHFSNQISTEKARRRKSWFGWVSYLLVSYFFEGCFMPQQQSWNECGENNQFLTMFPHTSSRDPELGQC